MCIRIIARTLYLASTSHGHLFSGLLREGDEMRNQQNTHIIINQITY